MRVPSDPSFVVDTSALISVLNDELDAEFFRQAFVTAGTILISPATIFEAHYVAKHPALVDGNARLSTLLLEIAPETVEFDEEQLTIARSAYALYGRNTGHPASLNIGDCFAYALAKSRNMPLLFKGDDFVHTDIVPALTPA
ncbi:type II toxin-antitoxin system VapC family toxin [Nitratireductor indicus]|uniref:type II toxin-antitoxin system VapC family toxin n=1 Tax=Nitratireductor indicus TaxID=721133 RepID=UPI0028764DDE|nr:type II toxin-antitoxin system VapC family toxin [Nitratireductor indicus]MDS1137087.1 type II toxin-antitoxin system VapC family toxin [Nitratireductor indicus]